jgi:hypothetical protein
VGLETSEPCREQAHSEVPANEVSKVSSSPIFISRSVCNASRVAFHSQAWKLQWRTIDGDTKKDSSVFRTDISIFHSCVLFFL